MRYSFRVGGFALALLATLQAAAPIRAEEDKGPPADPQPKIFRMTINVAGSQSVHYTVQNGTPRLQTVYRMLEWAENEMTIVEQMQQLKMEYVRNERQREERNASGGFPGSGGAVGDWESSLKIALSQELAGEATPEAAVQAIQLLQRAEADAANELKQLAPKDRQALDLTNKKMQEFVAANTPKKTAAPPAPPATPSPAERNPGLALTPGSLMQSQAAMAAAINANFRKVTSMLNQQR
jgi:hypothetical protein